MKKICPALILLLSAGCTGIPKPHSAGSEHSYERMDSPSSPVVRPAQPFSEQPTFDDYLNYAFTNNAALNAAREEWIAMQERVRQARTLEDPTLSFDYMIEQYDTRYQAGLNQSLPFPGTLSLREKKADAEAMAARHRFENARFMIYDRMAVAVFNYHYLGRTIAVYEEQIELILNQEAVARQGYSAGETSYTFLLRLQMEREKLESDLASRRDERAVLSSTISSLLNIPDNPALPWPHIEPAESGTFDYELLEMMLAELNPELRMAQAEVEAAAYQKRLAEKARWPSFSVGVGVIVMNGMENQNDQVDVGLSGGISLPLWQGSYRAGVREAAAEARAAAETKINLENELRSELRLAIYKVKDAERRLDLYKEELIPKATQSLNVLNQNLVAGQANLIELIDAQHLLLEFKLQYERALADREIALAEIGCCIGQFTNAQINEPEFLKENDE